MESKVNVRVAFPKTEDYVAVLVGLLTTDSNNDLNKVCICTCVHCKVSPLSRTKTLE